MCSEAGGELEHLAGDVELRLLRCGVAEAHRARVAVAAQVVERLLVGRGRSVDTQQRRGWQRCGCLAKEITEPRGVVEHAGAEHRHPRQSGVA